MRRMGFLVVSQTEPLIVQLSPLVTEKSTAASYLPRLVIIFIFS